MISVNVLFGKANETKLSEFSSYTWCYFKFKCSAGDWTSNLIINFFYKLKKTDIATQQFFEYFTGFHLDKNILIINTIKSKFSKCRKLCRYEFKIEIFNNNVVNTLTFRIVFCIDGNLFGTNLFLDQSNSVRSVLNSLNLKRSFEFFDIKEVESVKILGFFEKLKIDHCKSKIL